MTGPHRGDRFRRLAERALPVLFLAVVVATGYRFYLARHLLDFTDENDHTTVGWLLTQGETLYGSIFSHHMPLPYLAAHAVALVLPQAHPAHFRAVPWLAYLVVSLLLVLSPVGRTNRHAGWFAGSAFLVLVSTAIPPFWGHLLLMDNLAGCALAVFLAFVPLPALLGIPVRGRDAVTGGLAAGLALTASPMALFPLAAGLLPLATAFVREAVPPRIVLLQSLRIAAGAAVSVLLVAIWLAFFGSLSGFVTDVVVFNRDAYAPFLGEHGSSTGRMILSGLAEWARLAKAPSAPDPVFPRRIFLSFVLLALAAVGATCLAMFRRAGREPGRADGRRLPLAVLAALELLLILSVSRLRGFDFRALSFCLLVLSLASLSGGLLLATDRRIRDAVLGAVVVAPLALFSLRHFTSRVDMGGPALAPPEMTAIAEYVRTHTAPDERIAAFNVAPRLFLESRRRPATNALVYLPWQARWEALHPGEPSTCGQLEASRPRLIYFQPGRVFGAIDWIQYAGCVDAFIRANYEPLPDPAFRGYLWIRRTAGAAVPADPGARGGPVSR